MASRRRADRDAGRAERARAQLGRRDSGLRRLHRLLDRPRDGSRAWKIYALPDGYDHAITHAAFSPDGSKFAWTERVKAPRFWDLNLFAGGYVFKVADFVLAPEPHLENVRSIVPGNVDQGGEIESIAADNQTIAFYSTYVSKNLFASRIYTMDIETGVIRELTTESFAQAPTFTPDGKSIVYMTGAGADIFPWQLQGADWWIMNVDGSDKRRLTFMNVRGHAAVGEPLPARRLALVRQRHVVLRRRHDAVARARRQDRSRRLRLTRSAPGAHGATARRAGGDLRTPSLRLPRRRVGAAHTRC